MLGLSCSLPLRAVVLPSSRSQSGKDHQKTGGLLGKLNFDMGTVIMTRKIGWIWAGAGKRCTITLFHCHPLFGKKEQHWSEVKSMFPWKAWAPNVTLDSSGHLFSCSFSGGHSPTPIKWSFNWQKKHTKTRVPKKKHTTKREFRMDGCHLPRWPRWPGSAASTRPDPRSAAAATSPRRWWPWRGAAPGMAPSGMLKIWIWTSAWTLKSYNVNQCESMWWLRSFCSNEESNFFKDRMPQLPSIFVLKETDLLHLTSHPATPTSASWEKGNCGVAGTGPKHRTTNFTSSQGTKLRRGSKSQVHRSAPP